MATALSNSEASLLLEESFVPYTRALTTVIKIQAFNINATFLLSFSVFASNPRPDNGKVQL